MNITQEKLNEIADEVRLLKTVRDGVGVNLNTNYGVYIEVSNYGEGMEYFIELNEIDEDGAWIPCALYNECAPFGDIQRFIEIVKHYVEAFKEEHHG